MRDSHEITRDGPYLRLVLPDVLPPDWDAIGRELDAEIDEGATRVMVMTGDAGSLDTHAERFQALIGALEDQGLDVVVVSRDEDGDDVVPLPDLLGSANG